MNSNQHYELKEIEIQDIDIPSKCSNLAPEILDEYICHICLCLVKEPVSCSNCEEIICLKCIQQHLKNNKTCPKCQNYFSEKPVPKKVKNILDNLTIKCPNNNKNCKVKTKYPFLIKDHLNSCPYTERIATCKGCRADIKTTNKLVEIEEHIKTCQLILVNCPNCDSFVQRSMLKESEIENTKSEGISSAYDEVNEINHFKQTRYLLELKGQFGIQMESFIQNIYRKVNNAFKEVRITEKYDNDRFHDLLDLGINRLILNDYPVDLPKLLALRNNTNALQCLNMSNSSLTDDHALVIASILETNNILKELDLSNNNIQYKGADAIVNSLVKNNSLEFLSLSKNILDPSGLVMNIFHKLFSSKKISEVNFGQSLQHMLERNIALREILLNGCGLTNEEMTQMYLGLVKNLNVINLCISGNHISNDTLTLFKELTIKKRNLKLDI
jgi:hypothetical protein